MPPQLPPSDEESGGESIPFNNEPEESKQSEAESGSEDEDEEIYVVEKILSHDFAKKGGKLLFQVKWKGYDDPADETVEPEENLMEGAQEAIDEYFEKIGGRPEKPTKKRKSMGGAAASTPDKSPAKKGRKARASPKKTPESEGSDAVLNLASWEDQIESIDTIVHDAESGNLVVFLGWHNGKKSKVSLETCYERCPMKMLKFYEQHLVFKDG